MFYWLREGKSNNAEVDYVIQNGLNVIPIEVKSGSSGVLKSLHSFVAKKNASIGIRFDINKPSLQNINAKISIKNGETKSAVYKLINLPLYLSDWLGSILNGNV